MMTTDTKMETDNIKTEYSSIFGGAPANKVGTIGIINDGTYNVPWIICTISGNTYQLFPIRNLTTHQMNSTDTNNGGYTGSEMYGFVHNTVLPRLKQSGLNITACDLVSVATYMDIVFKTDMLSKDIAGGESFWLTDPYPDLSDSFYSISSVGYGDASDSAGVRPLITVVK